MERPEKDNSGFLENKVKLEVYDTKSRLNKSRNYFKYILSNKKILLILSVTFFFFAAVMLIPGYYKSNINSAAVIPLENETAAEIVVPSPIEVIMKLSCSMKFSDIESLVGKKYAVLSWFVEEFEGEKISPSSISIPGSELDLVIQLKKSKYEEYAVLKEAYLKNNINGEIIKKLNC